LSPTVPPHPGRNADSGKLASWYVARIAADPSDAKAFLELGKLEESQGFFHRAAERILIARALGLPDAETAGPLGRCWMKLGLNEKALVELQEAFRLLPKSHAAALNLAQLYAETGRAEEAAKVLDAFLQSRQDLLQNPQPGDREALERLMVAYVGLGEAAPAFRLAEQVIAVAPQQPNGYAVAGRCELARHRWPEAAKHFARAVDFAPDNADLRYLYGVALRHLPGRIDDALKQWQRAAELGSLAPAYKELGDEYEKRGDRRRAAIGALRAASLTETNAELYHIAEERCRKSGQVEMAQLCRARALGLRGAYDAALHEYRRLSRSTNPNMRSLGLDGAIDTYRALRRAGAYKSFVERECRSGSPEDEMRLADAYGEVGDNALRAVHLKKALMLKPSLAGHIHHELGVAAMNAGKRDEGETELLLAIRAEPDQPDHHRALARLYLDRRTVGGRSDLAVKEAEQTVALSPDSAEDHHLLGTSYVAAGKVGPAIRAFQRSIDLQPGYGPPYLDLGKLYAQIGDKPKSEEAVQLYRRYQAFDLEKQTLRTRANAHKQDATPQIALGDFYARANDFVHAREQYAKAVRLAPSNSEARKKYERASAILGMTPAIEIGSAEK
jgi:tetratricopeptide (TPR) repeat protein